MSTCLHCHSPHTYDPDDGYCCETQYLHGDSLPGDLPDATIEALAAEAAWEARCAAFDWRMAVRLAGGDAWVCERLGLAMGVSIPIDTTIRAAIAKAKKAGV